MGLLTLEENLLPESKKPSGRQSLRMPEEQAREPVFLVTDTSWWLEQGWKDAVEIARKVPEAFFVIPAGVMRELDGLKRNIEKGRRALEATKRIEELVRLGRARIETKREKYYNALASKTDEEVVRVAEKMAGRIEGKGKVFLLTTDKAQQALARQFGIGITPYEKVIPDKGLFRFLIEGFIIMVFLPFILIYRLFVPSSEEKTLALGNYVYLDDDEEDYPEAPGNFNLDLNKYF